MKIEMERVVVVSSLNGEKFVGMVAPFVTSEKLEQLMMEGRPFELFEVRNYIAQMTPQLGPQEEVLGMKSFAAFLPVDTMDRPVRRLLVRASHYYWVQDDPVMVPKVKRLFEAAEQSEMRMQAMESGIALP